MITALWWIRRDLRLADNPALCAAFEWAERVIPVFVLDPNLLDSPTASPKRTAFLLEGLRALDYALRARGSYLVIRRGDPKDELAALLSETGASAVFAQESVGPYGRGRDTRVAQALPLNLTDGLVVHRPGSILRADGSPYTVFTPFQRRWKALPLPSASQILPAPQWIPTPQGIETLPIPDEPTLPRSVPFSPGESEAQRRLAAFTSGDKPLIYAYQALRDRLDLDATSQLSPYLRFGMLSARQAVVAARSALKTASDPEAQKGAESWLSELIWREFYIHVLYHFPNVLTHSFRAGLRAIPWENDNDAFAAWCQGRTGYPFIDAAMRQLNQTGWMHNRARMVVASFLAKDLLIDWRWGERYFMQQLVDGDPPANNGGWQWSAGTGTDTVPYFRVFNPVLQAIKHDPQGAYVRRWLPELARVPDKYIHQPWNMPLELQRRVGCSIGSDYPHPLVDHSWARARALAAYRQVRELG